MTIPENVILHNQHKGKMKPYAIIIGIRDSDFSGIQLNGDFFRKFGTDEIEVNFAANVNTTVWFMWVMMAYFLNKAFFYAKMVDDDGWCS